MSYGLMGHFVDVKNKKVIVSAEIDFMKNLNSTRYSSDFEGIVSTSHTCNEEYPSITSYMSREFKGYYDRSILEDPLFADNNTIITNTYRKNDTGYVFKSEFFDENEEFFKKHEVSLPLKDLVDNEDRSAEEKLVLVFVSEKKQSRGTWYKMNDFVSELERFEKKYEERKARVAKLVAMQDTVEWFEMSEDARNNLLEEIGYAEEDADYSKYEYMSLQKMCNVLEFVAENVTFAYTDECGQTHYKWAYEDNRDIEVFVEVV